MISSFHLLIIEVRLKRRNHSNIAPSSKNSMENQENLYSGLQIGGGSNDQAHQRYLKQHQQQINNHIQENAYSNHQSKRDQDKFAMQNPDQGYTGLQLGNNQQPKRQPISHNAPEQYQKENLYMGSPNLAELNRERQLEDNQYSTGLQIGGVVQPNQPNRSEKNMNANNYHQMLDDQVAMKRESTHMKQVQDAQAMQDALDHQMFLQDKTNVERKNQYQYSQNEEMNKYKQAGEMNQIMGGEQAYRPPSMKSTDGARGKHNAGYNILTGI